MVFLMAKRRQKIDWSVVVPEATAARVIERIEAARKALGLTQIDFARRAFISPQQYTNWKTQGERPSVDQAIALCKAHGLTLEFLYRGDLSGLRHALHNDVAALLRKRK